MAVLDRSALVLLVALVACGCRRGPEQWGPFRGQVVDAETGAPIAGAHVMVSWERDNPNPVHWTQSFYDAQEAVTDADGRFEIPHESRAVTALVSAPRFGTFAPGYVASAEEVTPAGGRLFVDPTILRMRPLKTQEERCKLSPGGPGLEAGDKAPRFAGAIHEYKTFLNCHFPEGR